MDPLLCLYILVMSCMCLCECACGFVVGDVCQKLRGKRISLTWVKLAAEVCFSSCSHWAAGGETQGEWEQLL